MQRFRKHNLIMAVPENSIRPGVSPGDKVLVYKTVIKLKPLMEILHKFCAGRDKLDRL
jgi:hypothetical protein